MSPPEKPINITKLLFQSHTSTDGSVSPKPRWSRGVPPLEEPEQLSVTPTTTTACSGSGDEGKSAWPVQQLCQTHVAWAWLMEDELETEPRLQKSDQDPVDVPLLLDTEREVLCRNVKRRLIEVGRGSSDVSALVDEYLRFLFLRKQLDEILTLEPSVLVDDAWQAHTASDREYTAFCDRTFGEGARPPYRVIDPTKPVLYDNALCAYRHFFGGAPPPDVWPAPAEQVDGEESEDSSGRRTTFIRSPARLLVDGDD